MYFNQKYQERVAAQSEFEKEIEQGSIDNRVLADHDDVTNHEDYGQQYPLEFYDADDEFVERSEEGDGQLEYDHSSNSELDLLTNIGDTDDQDQDLFTFNNAELYVIEPGDNTDFDAFEFEVFSFNI